MHITHRGMEINSLPTPENRSKTELLKQQPEVIKYYSKKAFAPLFLKHVKGKSHSRSSDLEKMKLVSNYTLQELKEYERGDRDARVFIDLRRLLLIKKSGAQISFNVHFIIEIFIRIHS